MELQFVIYTDEQSMEAHALEPCSYKYPLPISIRPIIMHVIIVKVQYKTHTAIVFLYL